MATAIPLLLATHVVLLLGLATVVMATPSCPEQCDCFNYDDTVDCSHRGLDQLPGLSNITRRLYLEDNQLTDLPRRAFRSAAGLSLLVLERNELTALSTQSFCGLYRLQELDLGGNRIRIFSVDPSPFSPSSSPSSSASSSSSSSYEECRAMDLREINLSLNLLKSIPLNLSSFAPFLEILNLSYNEIESAALDLSYAEMTSLRHLDLSRNRIHEIFADDFRALYGIPLEILNLAECSLINIEDDALRYVGNLSSLMLSNNKLDYENLEKVLTVAFPRGNSLGHLDLSEIILPNITMLMLGSFDQLVILDASFCEVEHVDAGLFQVLSNLKTLHLEFGRLVRLENLSALSKLQRLYLQDNHLTAIEIGSLVTLESVDISYNRLNHIPSLWLTGLRNLQILNLSHNLITAVESNAFKQVAVISTLDLSYNRIRELRNYGLVRLASLDVSHNALEVVEDGAFDNLHLTLNEVDFSHNNLTRLGSAIFRYSHNVQVLKLGHNSLGEFLRGQVFEKPFDNLQLLRTLDLSHNDLSFLACEQLAALHRLEVLQVQTNQIADLRDLGLGCVPTLTRLVVADNQLRSADVAVLDQLGSLEELDLSDNPFDCNCTLLPFARWINESAVRIARETELDRYRCSTPASEEGKSVFAYHSILKDCPSNAALILSAASDGLDSRHYLVILSMMTLVGMTIGVVLILLICRYRCVCNPMKTLNYHWQIRYREVSNLETAVDGKM